ncbi:MAG: nucleotidyltransferase domain-containing protein [Natronincolaceae bacterium]
MWSEMNIKNVYIYGSAAKGRATEDSDIDIAVVGDDFISDPVEDTFKLMKLRRLVSKNSQSHPLDNFTGPG